MARRASISAPVSYPDGYRDTSSLSTLDVVAPAPDIEARPALLNLTGLFAHHHHGLDLRKRQEPLTAAQFYQYANDGGGLNCLMDLNIQDANSYLRSMKKPDSSQSIWTDYAALRNFGWTRDDNRPPNSDNILPEAETLAALGIHAIWDQGTGGMVWAYFEHSAAYMVDDRVHRGTGGYYEQIYDPTMGAIYVSTSLNPRNGEDPDPDLPDGPFRWSDVTFLAWTQICEEVLGVPLNLGLKFIFKLNIVNDRTRDVVDYIMRNFFRPPTTLNEWELNTPRGWAHRIEYNVRNTQEGRALLTTPNVVGVAWLLINHKEQMGMHKHVSKISVWYGAHGLSLCIHIED